VTTFSDIKSRIADELDRSDLGSQIERECIRAVQHYEKRRWWFNENLVTLTSSTSQASYSLSSDVLFLDTVELQRSAGSLVELVEVSWSRYQDSWRYNTTGTNQPLEWAYYTDMLWLGPIPDQAYNLTLGYVRTLFPQSFTDGTDNVWTNFADDLISARAEKILGARILGYKTQDLLVLDQLEKNALTNLCELSEQKIMTGTIRPWCG